MKILYLDFFLGMEPEMLIGALVSLGVDKDAVETELKKAFPDAGVECRDVKRAGLEAVRCDVVLAEDEIFDCDKAMAYADSGVFDDALAVKLKKIFETYFSEAKNAKIPKKEICRLCALFIALELLNADYVISSAVHEGSGFYEKDGGFFMLPSQATIGIFEKYCIPMLTAELEEELTGALGASALSVVANEFGAMPEMNIEKIGYGAGACDYELPNLMRAVLGSASGEDFEKMFASEEWFAEFSEEIFV